MNTSPSVVAPAIDLAAVPHDTLLAIGDCNHDFYLSLKSGNGSSRGVRAVRKDGDANGECSFGSVLYWRNQVIRHPSYYPTITPEGQAFMNADMKTLRELKADWGMAG